jgi:hypothetical protein
MYFLVEIMMLSHVAYIQTHISFMPTVFYEKVVPNGMTACIRIDPQKQIVFPIGNTYNAIKIS